MIKKIISFIPLEIVALLLILAIPAIGITVLSNKVSKDFRNHDAQSSSIPVPTQSPSPSPTSTPSPTTPTSKPSSAPVVTYIQPSPTLTPIPTQATKIDSAVQIELCKTKAETFKTQTMTALVLVYNQNNADTVKIANTSSVEELVNVGISIGLLTREQYNSDPSGHQLALLQTRAKSLEVIKSFMDTVNLKGTLAYNDYYAKCLNNENY